MISIYVDVNNYHLLQLFGNAQVSNLCVDYVLNTLDTIGKLSRQYSLSTWQTKYFTLMY